MPRLKLLCLFIEDFCLLLIIFLVLHVPLNILESVLDHRDEDNGAEGRSHDGLSIGDGYVVVDRHHGYDEEVNVGHFRELDGEQVQRDEIP